MPLVQLTVQPTARRRAGDLGVEHPQPGQRPRPRRDAPQGGAAPRAGHHAELAATGTPAVIMGDFNDGKDGQRASHCVLTPELSNAFGGSAEPCKRPSRTHPSTTSTAPTSPGPAPGSTTAPRPTRSADHPLVTATTAGSSAGCAVATETALQPRSGQAAARPGW